MAETPGAGPAPAAAADLRRIRTQLADAGGATRRAMERLRVARVITVAAIQVYRVHRLAPVGVASSAASTVTDADQSLARADRHHAIAMVSG